MFKTNSIFSLVTRSSTFLTSMILIAVVFSIALTLASLKFAETSIAETAVRVASRQGNLTASSVGQTLFNTICDESRVSFCAIRIEDETGNPLLEVPTPAKEPPSLALTRVYKLQMFTEPLNFRVTVTPTIGTVIRNSLSAALISLLPLLAFIMIATASNQRRLKSDLLSAQLNLDLAESEAARAALAVQVAHDIRSPLSALKFLAQQLEEVSAEKRSLLLHVIKRIGSIADNLDSSGMQPTEDVSAQELSSLVDSIVREKQLEAETRQYEIVWNKNQSPKLFSKLDVVEMQRALSNIINNAIESLPNGMGKVSVTLFQDQQSNVIAIEDTGKGIPESLIGQLGQRGVSFKASGQGSGLGIFHAKKTLESCGGELQIESVVGTGTKVFLKLPKSHNPSWFASAIDLSGIEKVVVVDDDETIHILWKNRLQHFQLPIISYYSISSFVNQLNSFGVSTLFLIDNDFPADYQTGIEVIEANNLSNSILITSGATDLNLRSRAEKIGIKVVDKVDLGTLRVSR